jgi:hypothetical protein
LKIYAELFGGEAGGPQKLRNVLILTITEVILINSSGVKPLNLKNLEITR